MKKILSIIFVLMLAVSPVFSWDGGRWDSGGSSGSGTGDMEKATYDTDANDVVDTASALAANGANCAAGEYPLGVDASGAVESCTDATTEISSYAQPLDATLTDIADGTIEEDLVNTTNPWADNEVADDITAGTAAALAANGANCNAGEIPLGVDASGAVEGCYEPATTDITGINAGTDITADLEEESHASEHAVSATDTVFPADPNADQYLMWDDDPGSLVWSAVSGGGAFSDSGDPVVMNTTTKDVVIGTAQKNTSKFTIDGDAAQVQLTIQGDSAQAAVDLFVIEDSNQAEVVTWDGPSSSPRTFQIADGEATGRLQLQILNTENAASSHAEVSIIQQSAATQANAVLAMGVNNSIKGFLYVYNEYDDKFVIGYGNGGDWAMSVESDGAVIFNDLGAADNDFTIESDTITNAVFFDADGNSNKGTLDVNVAFKIPTSTVANLPAAGTAGRIQAITDGASASDCGTGGGSTYNICTDNGSSWEDLT